MLKFDFNDKVAIVTGAGSGIGECIAKEFAKSGAKVVVADIKEDNINRVSSEIGPNAFPYVIDVTKYADLVNMMKIVNDKYGHIDILVNSAGICTMAPIDSMPLETVDAILDIDLKGTIYACKAVTPYMKDRRYGKIVNMSSIAGRICDAGMSIYSTAKAGVMAVSTSLGRELAPFNINVNSILPGIIRTNMWEGLLDEFTNNDQSKREDTFLAYTNSIPMKRPQECIDIANMVMYLCSDEGSNIEAQNIAVDGGQTLSL